MTNEEHKQEPAQEHEVEREPEREPEPSAEILRTPLPPAGETEVPRPSGGGGGEGGGPRRSAASGAGKPWLTWVRFQVAALLAFVVASTVLISGLDVKKSPPPVPPAAEQGVIADEIVVDFKDGAKEEDIAALGATLGVQFRYIYSGSVGWKGMIAKVPPAAREEILAKLRTNPLVEAAGTSHQYKLYWDGAAPPNDPRYGMQWNFKFIGMEEAWRVTRGAGAVVAVIDSGVASEDYGPWREGQDLKATKFEARRDIVNDDEHPEDDVTHGTHVTGTIAQSTDNGLGGAGIAPEATIIPIKVCNPQGCRDADITAAIRWATEHGARVINMSLGGPSGNDVTHQAMIDAHKRGVTMVCAAGNELQEHGPNHVGYPASFPECIAVSSVGPRGDLAPYSDYGDPIDIAAPGGDSEHFGQQGEIWQEVVTVSRRGASDQFAPKEGTSMAAPHVAGVAALLVSLGITDPDEIRSILRRSAKPRGAKEQYGAGLLDAAAAVKLAKEGGRQSTKRWWLVGLLGVVSLGVAFRRWKTLGIDASLPEVLIPLAIGLCLPDLVQWLVGFGSLFNMVGHSIAIPILWLNLRGRDVVSLRRALCVTVGLVVHLSMDAQSGVTPFAVLPPWRSVFWMYVNAGIGVGLLLFAFEERRARRPAPAAGPRLAATG
jgi:serine protease